MALVLWTESKRTSNAAPSTPLGGYGCREPCWGLKLGDDGLRILWAWSFCSLLDQRDPNLIAHWLVGGNLAWTVPWMASGKKPEAGS